MSRAWPRLGAYLLAWAVLAGCGGADPPAVGGANVAAPIVRDPQRGRTVITVGSKRFTESRILAEIGVQGLRAAGYDARRSLDVGDERANLAALRDGRIDAYPEYTTTALTSFFDVDLPEVPRTLAAAYADANRAFRGIGLRALAPAPLNDSQGVGMLAAEARRLGIRSLSDLRAHAGRMTLVGPPECRTRPDCLPGLAREYGLRFRRFDGVDPAKRYERLDGRRADVAIVFTTDGQLARGGYVVLRDDRRLFPAYHPMLIVDGELAGDAGPGLERTVDTLQANLTTPVMQGLNAAVDLDGRSPRQTAREYLEAYGLVE